MKGMNSVVTVSNRLMKESKTHDRSGAIPPAQRLCENSVTPPTSVGGNLISAYVEAAPRCYSFRSRREKGERDNKTKEPLEHSPFITPSSLAIREEGGSKTKSDESLCRRLKLNDPQLKLGVFRGFRAVSEALSGSDRRAF